MKKTSFELGHILIKVKSLKEAIKNFEAAGFKVVIGGESLDKTHNAMIYFKDGSFIELFEIRLNLPFKKLATSLLSMIQPLNQAKFSRFKHYITANEGYCDYALDSPSKDQFINNIQILKDRHLFLYGPMKMNRKNYQGIELKWQLYVPSNYHFPFLMSPYSPSIEKTIDETTHVNGAHSIKQLTIAVRDLNASISFYSQLLNQEPKIATKMKEYRFGLAGTTIILKESQVDGITEVQISCNDLYKPKSLLMHDALIHLINREDT